jgi:acetolactate synthase-1/2/3 large subunit
MTKKRAAGELVAAALQGLGVSEVFALHGSHLDPLFMACEEFGIRLTDTRHEASAGHAADAYARASNGKLGVCAVTAGPGFTNALTAITNAWLDRIPVLFIAGAAPIREAESNTLQGGFDAVAMARPVTKWAQRVAEPGRIVEYVRRAGEIALSGSPGPVFLEIPIDVMFWPTEEAAPDVLDLAAPGALRAFGRCHCRRDRNAAQGRAPGDHRRRRRDADQFGRSAAAAGRADRRAGDRRARRRWACCPTTILIMAARRPGLAAAAAAGQPTDAVLLVGVRMGMFLGGAMGAIIPQAAYVAQIETNPEEIGRVRMADLPIVADAGVTLDALLAAAEGQDLAEARGMGRAAARLPRQCAQGLCRCAARIRARA